MPLNELFHYCVCIMLSDSVYCLCILNIIYIYVKSQCLVLSNYCLNAYYLETWYCVIFIIFVCIIMTAWSSCLVVYVILAVYNLVPPPLSLSLSPSWGTKHLVYPQVVYIGPDCIKLKSSVWSWIHSVRIINFCTMNRLVG